MSENNFMNNNSNPSLIRVNRNYNRDYSKLNDVSTIKRKNKSSKFKFILASLLISLIISWLFIGKHNNKELISQELPIADNNDQDQLKADINSESSSTNAYTNKHAEQQNTTKQSETTSPEKPDNLDSKSDANIITAKIKLKRNESLSHVFKKLNLDNHDLNQIITNKEITKHLKKLRYGQTITVKYNQINKNIDTISYYIDKFNQYIISKNKADQKISGAVNKLNLDEKTNYAKLTINSSLFEDAQKQKLDNNLIYQIMDIFTWDIDFAQDLRSGDTVDILFKEYYRNGQPYATGPILAVNFLNNKQLYQAVRFEANNRADYFTPDGHTLRKAFIRTPVKFTRISSRFSLGRKHPLLHRIRAHRGVDYAAPSGTPIKAAGDGKIIHYGRKGGYGKAAIIQHGTKYTTLYAHMSRYNHKLRRGSYVKQGQIIGYVGQTGLATGPHLHYEFRMNGEHKNPLTVALPKAQPIPNKYKNEFKSQAGTLLASLNKFKNHPHEFNDSLLAKNNFE